MQPTSRLPFFKPLFEQVQNDLDSGGRETRQFKDQAR